MDNSSRNEVSRTFKRRLLQGSVLAYSLLLLLAAKTHADHDLFEDRGGLGFPGPLKPQYSVAARQRGYLSSGLPMPQISGMLDSEVRPLGQPGWEGPRLRGAIDIQRAPALDLLVPSNAPAPLNQMSPTMTGFQHGVSQPEQATVGTDAIAIMAYQNALQSVDHSDAELSNQEKTHDKPAAAALLGSYGPGLSSSTSEKGMGSVDRQEEDQKSPPDFQHALERDLSRLGQRKPQFSSFVQLDHREVGNSTNASFIALPNTQADTIESTAPVVEDLEEDDESLAGTSEESAASPIVGMQPSTVTTSMKSFRSSNPGMPFESSSDENPRPEDGIVEQASGEATSGAASGFAVGQLEESRSAASDGANPAAQVPEFLSPMTQISPSPSLGQIEQADFRNGVTLLQSPSDLSSSGPSDEETSRTVTGSLPGARTLTVTATTSQPSPERAQKAAQGLVNFAQGVASGAQAVSNTLEEAAKTVSKDMPSVVSFAASTAHSLLSSLQTVESSVIRASSMVASSLRSLPDVAERQFSLAPSASPEDLFWRARLGGRWDAHAAAPAPAAVEPAPAMDIADGGTFDRLARLAQRATERVAANIGAAQDDSGPVLGTMD